MSIAVTGPDGLLGGELMDGLRRAGHQPMPLLESEIDITDADALGRFFSEHKPETVYHLAAYTHVDAAEEDVDRVFAVNAFGTYNLCRAAAAVDCRVIYLSTDYVFDGLTESPYLPEDEPNPLNVYGMSKLAGEFFTRAYAPCWLIVRSSSLYGPRGEGFPVKLCRRARNGDELRVVEDQFSSPTYAPELADALVRLGEYADGGIFHLTNSGVVSWYDFALRIVEILGLPNEVVGVSSGEFAAAARRPARSELDTSASRELGIELRPWSEALDEYLADQGVRLRVLAGVESP